MTSALVAAGVYAAPDPNPGLRSSIAFHDFGHVVAFGLVTWVLAFALSVQRTERLRDRIRDAGLSAAAAVGIGIAVELAQAATGGNGDPGDVMRDAGGALSVALMWVAGHRASSARLRALLVVGALALLAAFSVPTLAALAEEAIARAQFPVLAAFESTRELSRFSFDPGVRATLVPMEDEEHRRIAGMKVGLLPGKYSGFALRYFPRDWRSMRTLRLLLVNPRPTQWAMTVRLDDAAYNYKRDAADRYTQSFLLKPGPNRIDIPLADVAAAPRGRRFDLERVKLVLVYAVDLAETREILVGPIVLQR